MLQMKLRKVNDIIEAKWALLGGRLAKGDLTATPPDDDGKYRIVISPKGKPDFNIDGVFLVKRTDGALSYVNIGLTAESEGVTSLSYAGEWDQVNNDQVYQSDFHSEFFISRSSRLFKYFCKLSEDAGIECFSERKMVVNIKIDRANKNNLLFRVDNSKDKVQSMLIDINMIDAPYKVELVSERLEDLLGTNTFLMNIINNPGHLEINCNYQELEVHFKYPAAWEREVAVSAELVVGGVSFVKYDRSFIIDEVRQ